MSMLSRLRRSVALFICPELACNGDAMTRLLAETPEGRAALADDGFIRWDGRYLRFSLPKGAAVRSGEAPIACALSDHGGQAAISPYRHRNHGTCLGRDIATTPAFPGIRGAVRDASSAKSDSPFPRYLAQGEQE